MIGEYVATGAEAERNGVVFGRVCSLTHSIALASRQMEAVRHRKILELCQATVVKLALESENDDPLPARVCYVVFKKSLGNGDEFSLRAREALHQWRTCFGIAATTDPKWAALSIASSSAPLREFSMQIVRDMVASFAAKPLAQITHENFYVTITAVENFFAQERTLSQDLLIDRQQIETIVRAAIVEEHGNEEFEKIVECCRCLAQSRTEAIRIAALQSALFYGSFNFL